jgi:hypothetical protein
MEQKPQEPAMKEITPEVPLAQIFTFTEKELQEHDHLISEQAYTKAALCTIAKLSVLYDLPIYKAIDKLVRYAKYLAKTYNLKVK